MNKTYTTEKQKTPLVLCENRTNEVSYKRFVGKKMTNHICVDEELTVGYVEEFRLDPLGFMGIDDNGLMIA
jgi:hypothetical protein